MCTKELLKTHKEHTRAPKGALRSELRWIVSKAVKDHDTVISDGLSVDKGNPEQVLLRIFSGQWGR